MSFIWMRRQREAELEKLEEEDEENEEEEEIPSTGPDSRVIRSFRYMRRVPTIISYKPPESK